MPHVMVCPFSPDHVSLEMLLVKACCIGHLQPMDGGGVMCWL